jgi:lipopolysaccharide assembly protein A
MRALSGLFLLALIAVLGFLAYENNRDTVLNAWTWRMDVPLPLLIVAVYVLGMLSGWWLFGLVKRSWQRVTEPDRVRA